jgi:hypothetical protein
MDSSFRISGLEAYFETVTSRILSKISLHSTAALHTDAGYVNASKIFLNKNFNIVV